MRFILLFAYVAAFAWLFSAEAQQNINSLTTKDINVNGNLEVNSTSLASKPCPVMTEAQRNAIASPQSGRCIYNSNTNQLNIYNGTIWKSAGGGISNWETAFNYALNDVVIESNKIYQCNTAHTSSVFASDIANWTQIANDVSDASGILPMANGGTDKNLTPTLGGVVYTDANSMEVLGAGTSGQVLKSNGAAAPTWQNASNKIEGLGQTEAEFNKVQFKNKSVTETAAGVQLVETDRNLLANGSFEHLSYQSSWTVTGSATVSRETSTVRDGKAAFKAVTTGNSFRVEQNTTQLAGTNVPAYAVAWVNNTAAGVQVCSMLAGSDKDCVTALTDGTWQPYIIPMILGATSNGVSIHSGTTAGTTIVDWVRLVDEDLIGSAPVVGPRVQYTPTTQGLGVVTPSSNACSYTQFGPTILIECKLSGATISASELRVGLPTGMTVATGFTGYRQFNVGARDISASPGLKQYSIIGQSGNSYLNLSSGESSVTSNPLVPALANSLIGAGQNLAFSALVPIAELAASVPTYSDRCKDPRNCETVFSAKVSATGVVSDENLDWINGNCSGSSPYDCFYTSGLFSTTPNCSAIQDNTAQAGVGVVAVSDRAAVRTQNSSSGTLASIGFTITCQRQGQDYINAKVNQIVGSFKDYVRTPNTTTGKVGFCSAKISATGVISDQLGGCFASCTNATTPVCTFTSNYWRSGSVPNCTHGDGGDGWTVCTGTTSSSSFSGGICNGSLATVTGRRVYQCHGEIQ